MKQPNDSVHIGHTHHAQTWLAVSLLWAFTLSTHAQETSERSPTLPERQFRESLRRLERLPNPAEQAREADALLRDRWLSSQQVKVVARTITQEDARFSFALNAYPRTVDPENFYEVYDAFTNFSKVFRLHDQIQRQQRQPYPPHAPPPAPVVQQPITDEAFADLIKALRAEVMDDTRKALARQMLSGRPRFLSRQIRDLVKLFTFDDTRLEIAKYAYDAVLDSENYYLVNQAFTFNDRKEDLARYIESRRAERPPRPNR